MSDKALVEALQRERGPLLQGRARAEAEAQLMHAPFSPASASVARIVEQVRQHESLAPYVKGDYNFYLGRSSGTLTEYQVASAMAERVADGVDPHQVAYEMLSLFARGTARLVYVVALTGVRAPRAEQISDCIWFVPPEEVPPSVLRDGLFMIGRAQFQSMMSPGSHYRPLPSAALTFQFEASVIRRQSENAQATFLPEDMARFQHYALLTERIVACLTLSGSSAPAVAWTFTWPMDPALPYSGFGGYSYGGGMPELHSGPTGDVDASLARTLLGLVQRFPDWPPISFSVGRLNRSRRQGSIADRAADLGIALEALLMHSSGNRSEKDQTANLEIGYKLASRGAWLTAKDPENRLRAFKTLQTIYGARSAAVHSGQIRERRHLDALPKGDELCSEIIRAILERGEFPDWKALVLGLK